LAVSRLGPWISEIGGKMRLEKLSDPRKPKLRRNRITNAAFWPFWPPGNRIDAKFGAPAEIPGLERLTAKFAYLQNPQPVDFETPSSPRSRSAASMISGQAGRGDLR
jgi:hypothetical protein